MSWQDRQRKGKKRWEENSKEEREGWGEKLRHQKKRRERDEGRENTSF